MSDKKGELNKMLDAIINDKPEEAQIAFHTYLGDKMKQSIHGDETPEPKTTKKDEE